MKTFTRYLLGAILLGGVSYAQKAHATVWVINTLDFVFSPENLTGVQVGDTVRWVWIEGIHTTTSSTIPEGAMAWDSPMTSSVTSFDYVPTVAGTYHYVCTPHAEFGMVGTFTVMGASDVKELSLTPHAILAPNPFRDKVTVLFTDKNPGYKEIRIFDESGKMVRNISIASQAAVQSKEIYLGELSPGLYVYEFLDEQNRAYYLKGIRE